MNKDMRITVMSRYAAMEYCAKRHEDKSVIISISDPHGVYDGSPFVGNKNNVIDILRLSFADADYPGRDDVYGRVVTESDLMSDEYAKNVADFVERYKDCLIIVHCDAGISRSSGVAAAIMKYYNGSDDAIFDSRRFHPNMWCYAKTLRALAGLGM